MYFQSFKIFQPLTLQLDHAKLLDVLTSLPESHAVLLHIQWFVTSHLKNHVTCTYISHVARLQLQSEDAWLQII